MNKVLVTGATGCIGSNLIARLLECGCSVRAFHRENSVLLALEHIDVEHRTGDIRDPVAVLAAMQGCDTVFHTAAIVSFWKRRREEQLDVNINGTRTVVEACLKAGVNKLVHTSSIAALGFTSDGSLITETTAFNWNEGVTYKYSKYHSELEVLNGVARGLNASIVNPSVVIGPRDAHIHGGAFVLNIARKRVPAYIAGGVNLVGVHDVVRGHIAAAERGQSGERYILGGVNLSHKEMFALIAKVLNKPVPLMKAPVWSVRLIAKLCESIGEITDSEPWISSELISGIGKTNWYSSEKAKRELGFNPQITLKKGVRRTLDWYRKEFY